MPFTKLVYFLLNQVKQSSQTALDRFFEQPGVAKDFVGEGYEHMSQQAFSAARAKFKWEACRELMDLIVSEVYECGYSTWHGYRVWGIDGSKVQLPSDPALCEAFGVSSGISTAATAQGSCLYDVQNDIIGDARLEPMSVDERSLAEIHINHLRSMESFDKELIIFDRGYPSRQLIRTLEEANVRYVMRVKKGFCAGIDRLCMGDHRYTIEHEDADIHLRVLKFSLKSGEIETIITDLFDRRMSLNGFRELYFKRWPIETKYAELKHKIEVENFSGRTKNAILQDFFISIHLSNFLSIAALEAQPIIDDIRKDSSNLYDYQVNKNHAVGVFKDRYLAALLEPNNKKRGILTERILTLLIQHPIPIKPDRSVSRYLSPRNANFHHNYKSNA